MFRVFLSITLFSLLISSCKKDEVQGNLLVGEWSLEEAERLINGTPTTVKVPRDVAVIVEFSKKNEFKESYKNTVAKAHSFLACGGGTYELEEANKIRIRAVCMSSLSGRVFIISKLSESQLILTDEIGGTFSFAR